MANASSAIPGPVFRILHTTDLSAASGVAFAHALRLALAARAELDLFHVTPQKGEPDWAEFPGVRNTLHRWGVPAGSAPQPGAHETGLRIGKIVGVAADPVRSVLEYIERHPTELVVLATHRRDGIDRWFHKAVAEPIARASGETTLFLPEGVKGFVSPDTGAVTLRHVLIPIDHAPAPQTAVDATSALLEGLGCTQTAATILHVGDARDMPPVKLPRSSGQTWEQITRGGEPVEAIVQAATERVTDLVVMTTQGRDGFLDALRGSTTERVLHRAPCPLLAVPAGSRAMARLFSGGQAR